MADLISEWLGPEALPFRVMLGAVAGIFLGLAALLVGLLRMVVVGPLLMLSGGAVTLKGTPLESAHELLAWVIPYFVTFMVAGMVYGLIGSWRKTLVTSIIAGCLLADTLISGFSVFGPHGHGSIVARVTEDTSLLLTFSVVGGVVGGFQYLRSAWEQRGGQA